VVATVQSLRARKRLQRVAKSFSFLVPTDSGDRGNAVRCAVVFADARGRPDAEGRLALGSERGRWGPTLPIRVWVQKSFKQQRCTNSSRGSRPHEPKPGPFRTRPRPGRAGPGARCTRPGARAARPKATVARPGATISRPGATISRPGAMHSRLGVRHSRLGVIQTGSQGPARRLICHDPGLVSRERGFVRRVRGWKALTQAWNAMDLARDASTQAREASTQARHAPIEARFVADET
jgi:hypothetical protein